jgi:programmed cell death protein 4
MITNTALNAHVARVSHNKTNSGAPKKGGAGGKGTWGKGGIDDLKTTRVDRDDPNYCSDEEVFFHYLCRIALPYTLVRKRLS